MENITIQQTAKEIKKELKKSFKNVSVRMSRGTAYGWLTISSEIERPKECVCFPGHPYCEVCRKALNANMNEMQKKVCVMFEKRPELKNYHYTDDMGYESEERIYESSFLTKK